MSAAQISVPLADAPVASNQNAPAIANALETVATVPTVDDRVPAQADAESSLPAVELPAAIMNEAYHVAKDLVIAHFEKEYLAHLVDRSGGNMSKAARLANIDRTTIYRMMERHKLTRAQLPGLVS
jgi:transcriptional regulator of acetoin/glycerol metabolism